MGRNGKGITRSGGEVRICPEGGGWVEMLRGSNLSLVLLHPEKKWAQYVIVVVYFCA